MPRVLIGADVGGTKTAVAVSRDGKIVGRADGPGAAVRPGRALASSSTIAEVVRQALSSAGLLIGDVLLVGAAGVGREPERDELRKALRGENVASSVVVTTDIEIALAAAFADGPGIVVSAGTGSVAVGRDRTGKQHRIGGYGWQMGDEGSGYAIGRASLGAVSRAVDGRSPKTALSDRLLRATRSDDYDELVRWAAGASPAEVAALAPHVLAVAAAGDPLAQGIADYAARELSQLAICLVPKMDIAPPIPVAVTGGLLGTDQPLRKTLLAKLAEEPVFQPTDNPVDAVAGALRLADSGTP
ncbi:MAG TPA: BadF/BadG/BcrA/BcrD ATPase family protein [Gemmatimonadales bacterium]|jgi:glucosamine kinase|nr:BadF/BadG/BcrA/BcrD ATPase family protein [Gemmatimonadales bacterium]